MHTHTHAEGEPVHRHFVAIPLALAVVFSLFSLSSDQTFRSQASLFTAAPIPQGTVEEFGDVQVQAEGGEAKITALGSELALENGTVLLRCNGIGRIRVERRVITCLGGGAFLRTQSSSLSLAGISAPLLVTDEDTGGAFVVPAGMQVDISLQMPIPHAADPAWQTLLHGLRILPPSFVAERLQRVFLFPPSSSLPLPEEVEPVRRDPLVLFSSAQARRARVGVSASLGYIRHLMAQRREGELERYLSDAEVADALRGSTPAASTLVALVSQEGVSRKMQLLLLPFIVTQEDAKELLPFHPLLSDAALLTEQITEIRPDTHILRTFLLPAADRGQEAISVEAFARWRLSARITLTGEQSLSLGAALLHRMDVQMSAWEAAGFPERLVRYGEATLTLTEPLVSRLPEDALRVREHIQGLVKERRQQAVRGALEGVRDEGPIAVQTFEQRAVLSPEAAVERVSGILREAGAMIGVHTALRANGDGMVAVSHILFAGRQGMRDVSFVFDPHISQVSSLVADGTAFPYEVPFDQFLVWVRR